MKFKKGDRVKVVRIDPIFSNYYKKLIGNTYTIKRIDGDQVEMDYGCDLFLESELELVE